MDLTALFVYAGIGLGAGETVAPVPDVPATRDTTSAVAAAFVGARTRHVGLEAGLLSLPRYRCAASVSDYPAYKLAHTGEVVDSPASAEGTQEITSRAAYVRLNVYGPELWKLTPYVFYGQAWVRSTNVEHAVYTDPDETAHFEIGLNKRAHYYGGGVEAALSARWAVRVEAGTIPSATQSYWTGDRDVWMGTVNAVLRF